MMRILKSALVIDIAIIFLFIFLLTFSGEAMAKPYGVRLCTHDAHYICYTVKKGDSWQTLFPDFDKRDLVMRINRMNIRLHPGMRIAIPKNFSHTNMLDFSPIPTRIDPPGEKVILISLNDSQLVFGAYDALGNLQYWGPVSGGKGYCPDINRACHTAEGRFSIYRKEGAGCKSTRFPVGRGGAPMPYCMFFHGGFALHGSYEVPGYNASHGCIRLFVNDAKWLNENFTDGEDSVPVVVKSGEI
jgi:hypothetical protein